MQDGSIKHQTLQQVRTIRNYYAIKLMESPLCTSISVRPHVRTRGMSALV